MLFDCNNPCIVCPPGNAGDNPYLNLTSERPDEDAFIGRVYTADPPPLGSTFFALGCVSFCLSAVSQEEADLCALRQNMICLSVNWPGGGGPPTNPGGSGGNPGPRPLFGNTPQSCTYECLAGSQTNTITVPANTYFAFNQATANSFAHSLACLRANQQTLCLTLLSRSVVCLNNPSSQEISAGGVQVAGAFTISSGELPPGMSLEEVDFNTTSITGTPTVAGVYNFTIFCIDLEGNSGFGTYELTVLGITTTSPLSEGMVGILHSQTFTAVPAGIGIYTWAVTAGALPDGMTMNSATGTISGTPTTEQSSAFTVTVTDPVSGVSCSKAFTMEIAQAFDCLGNADTVQDLVWTKTALGAQFPCGILFITNGIGSMVLVVDAGCPLDFQSIESAPLCNPGDPYDVTVTIPWDSSGNVMAGVHTVQFGIYLNGVFQMDETKDIVTGPFTPFVLTVTVPTGASNVILVTMVCNAVRNPAYQVNNLGDITVTPLTPP